MSQLIVKTEEKEMYQIDTEQHLIKGGNIPQPIAYEGDVSFLLGRESTLHLSNGENLVIEPESVFYDKNTDINSVIQDTLDEEFFVNGDIPVGMIALAENYKEEAQAAQNEIDDINEPDSPHLIETAKKDLMDVAKEAENLSNDIKFNADRANPTMDDLLNEIQKIRNITLEATMNGRDGKSVLKNEMEKLKSGDIDTPYADLLLKQKAEKENIKIGNMSPEEIKTKKIEAVEKKYNEIKKNHSIFHKAAKKLEDLSYTAKHMASEVGKSIRASAAYAFIATTQPILSFGRQMKDQAIEFGNNAVELTKAAQEYSKTKATEMKKDIDEKIDDISQTANDVVKNTKEGINKKIEDIQRSFNKASNAITSTGKYLQAEISTFNKNISLKAKIADLSFDAAKRMRMFTKNHYITAAENRANTIIKLTNFARKAVRFPELTEAEKENIRTDCYKDVADKINTAEIGAVSAQEAILKSNRMKIENQLRTATLLQKSPFASEKNAKNIENLTNMLDGYNNQINIIQDYRTDLQASVKENPYVMIPNYINDENSKLFDSILSKTDEFRCVYTFDKTDLRNTNFADEIKQKFGDSIMVGSVNKNKLSVAVFDKRTAVNLEKFASEKYNSMGKTFDTSKLRTATTIAEKAISACEQAVEENIR